MKLAHQWHMLSLCMPYETNLLNNSLAHILIYSMDATNSRSTSAMVLPALAA